MGYQVRGVFVDGKKVYYRTAAEEGERHRQWVADEKAKKQAEAAKNAPEVDARISKLPQPFQDRIHAFRERNPEFRAEFESYELFCCEQAVVISGALKTPEAIEAFSKESYEAQKAMVPGIDDNHSGNTFGFSIRLAHLLASDHNETIKKSHGAMCPLVGCGTYGCYASSPEANAARAAAEYLADAEQNTKDRTWANASDQMSRKRK